MKPIFTLLVWLGFHLTLAKSQSYFIDRFTISGGGGTSTNGGYSVTGTIGQPAAGSIEGGGFVLMGGFWSGVEAIQTPEAPWLCVAKTATNTVVVSWPGPDLGWRLQTATGLSDAPVQWTEISFPYETNTAGFYFTTPVQMGKRFYRLYRP